MQRRSRASSSDQARAYRLAGHEDARQFAHLIGQSPVLREGETLG